MEQVKKPVHSSSKAPSLKDPEKILSLLMLNSEEPFVMVDTDLNILTYNSQFEKQYFRHFGKQIIKGTSILEYALKERIAVLEQIYKTVFEGQTYETELNMLLADNASCSLLLKFKPARDENGAVVGAFVSSTDISDIKKSQQEAKINEQRYKALVENGEDAMVILNSEGKLTYTSSSVGKVLGYTETEALSLDVFANIHPEDLEYARQIFEQVINSADEVIMGRPVRFLHKNGSWQWYEYTVTNMIANPAIQGLVANFRNVTKKVFAELEKEFDRNNLHALINNTNDLMWSISKDGKLITSNRAFDELVKLMSGNNVVKGGDAPTAGFSEEQLKKWELLYARAFSGETFTIVEYTEAPQELWSEISFYPIERGGIITGTACYSRNITERKLFERRLEKHTYELIQIKKELEKSEKSLKEAQEMANLGNWSHEIAANRTVWSDQVYKLLALNKNETQPSFQLLLSFVHKDDLEMVKKTVREGEQSQKGYSFNCRIMRKDGIMRHIYSDSKFLADKDGQPYMITGIIQDVTDSKNSEIRLQHSESRLKQAQALAHIGNWEMNFASNTSIWSDEAYRIYGLEPGPHNLSFEQWREFVHPEDLEGFSKEIRRVHETLSDMSYSHRIIRKDGNVRYVVSESRYEFNDKGEPIGLYGVVHDVTERKLADEEIRVAKERYDLVAKATNDAIYDWDLKTNTVIRPGEGLEVLFGLETGEATNDPGFWKNRVHPDDAEACYLKLQSHFKDASKKICDMEYRFRKADGSYAYVYDKGYIVRNAEGEALRVLGATQDITHRKETEILLKELNERLEKRADELALSNKELEQFAYIASHDLQEPLRMVTSFLTQLESKYKSQLDERAQKYIHFATDGAVRMRRIILDLLEYSRVGRQNNDKKQVDLNEILSEAVQLNKAVIDEKNALVDWKDLPSVKGNRLALQQVFQNLINNALKYQKPGQKPALTIRSAETDTHWELCVSDNGIGIESQYFDKIFVVFQRLHNKDEYSGTGIGLAICKKIVENHQGRIWVESEYGSGSTFHFTIDKNL